MRFRTLLAVVASGAVAVFVILNWRMLAAPLHLSFLFTTADVPAVIVMLALFALAILAISGYVSVWQGTLLLEFRRQARELQAQRTLAESAETSRFTELGTLIRAEVANSDQRVEAALEGLRAELRAAENSIAATLGEMDDRYQRSIGRHAG